MILCSTLAGSQISPVISGTVRDSAGAPIADADVAIHWNSGLPKGPDGPKAKDSIVKTDSLGKYSIVVAEGYYDVCVHARFFSPSCTTVEAREAKTAAYNPRLKANALIVSPD